MLAIMSRNVRPIRLRMRHVLVALAVGLWIALPAALHAANGAPDNPGADIIHYLNQTIDWYRRVAAFDQSSMTSEEVLFRDTVNQDALKSLQLGFSYAQAEGRLIAATQPASGPANAQATRLAQAAATAVQRTTQLETELEKVEQDLRSAGSAAPPELQARRDELAAELNLARTRQDVLQNMVDFSSTGTSGGLLQQVSDLENAIPEAQADTQSGPATRPSIDTSAAQQPVRPSSLGILGLIEEMFTLAHKMSDLKDLENQTAQLRQINDKLRAPVRAQLLDAIHQADVLKQVAASADAAALNDKRKQFEDLNTRFKMLSDAAVPLGKQNAFLDTTETTLTQWRGTVETQYGRALRYLLIRLGAMAVAIFILLLISKLWRRATFKYVTDIRRRRQFLLIRRLVVGGIVTLIIVAGVVTEFGSLATYAGLLTAGIAVALQSVILSGAAHFFFLGRYGVRVGDRVTISGVTGDVIDIGIFRLYMMELGGKNADLQPTGRIVVFSNSVLFQSSAFYKQIPGAEYNWHEVGLTLSPDSDYHLAEEKLLAAVQSVYGEYRESIEAQRQRASDSIHIQLSSPEPQGRLRFVDSGLEFVVRYPVDIRRAAEIDDQITRKLLETIEKEPKLKLVATSTPKIQSADAP
jgi:small-conductance mechanosensitive channel